MSFETRKFRDIEVVVNTSDPDRAINLTKLASTLTGSRQAFRDIIRDNKAFFELIDSYISSLEDQSLMGGNPPVNIQASRVRNLKWLVNEGILVEKLGKPNWNAGVYGPTYLADWIVINCCPKFFKQIHDLFEVVEKTANLKNFSKRPRDRTNNRSTRRYNNRIENSRRQAPRANFSNNRREYSYTLSARFN